MRALTETLDTPDGPLVIVADREQRVLATGWNTAVAAVLARIHPTLRPDTVCATRLDSADAARAYYDGDIEAIDRVAVRQHGTALQRAGWRALRTVPPGAPLTYTAFAAEFGAPRAVRAAASICARNAVALFVPCHRVIRTDGTLGGFAWGLSVKASLLAREAGEARDARGLPGTGRSAYSERLASPAP